MRIGRLISAIVAVVASFPAQFAGADDSISLPGSRTEAAVERYISNEGGDSDPGGDALAPAPTYLVSEILFLQLNGPRRQGVVIDEDSGDTLLTTSELRHGMEAGARLTVGIPLYERRTLEISYFGLQHWAARRDVEGDDNLSLPGDIALATSDFFDADRMRFHYSSALNNAEVTLVRPAAWNDLALLAGFRYVGLREQFGISSFDGDAGASDYTIDAENHLFGAQVGGRLQKQRGRFGLDFVGKAGLFASFAQQHTFLGDSNNTVTLRNSTTRGCQAAFLGELGLTGKFELTRGLWFRGGYSALWLEGVARAPDQLDFTDTATSGTALVYRSAFLHGPNVGLEAQW